LNEKQTELLSKKKEAKECSSTRISINVEMQSDWISVDYYSMNQIKNIIERERERKKERKKENLSLSINDNKKDDSNV
jgi:beta-glucosidase/6-phospho-beta-glucosidase/beta-galactosidase